MMSNSKASTVTRNTKCKHSKVKNYKLLLNFQCSILVDGAHCLPRLYGSKTIDWVSGGQWYEMLYHLSLLVTVQKKLNIEFVFFFDGATKVSLQPQVFLAQPGTSITIFRTNISTAGLKPTNKNKIQ